MDAIAIEGLHKQFTRWHRGRRVTNSALNGLDLEVPSGGVYGFLGPNGSGKTTTIRCLLGLVRPTAGRCRLFGRDVAEGLPDVLPQIGTIVESPALFPTLTGRRNVELLARVASIGPKTVDRVIEQVGLAERADELVKGYSLGMRQRLALAIALLKDPALLMLDEPANGLDPAGIRETRQLLRYLGDEGRTVFISSHYLAEIEQICDAVAIISHGQCVTAGTVADVLHTTQAGGIAVRLADTGAGRDALALAGIASRVDGDELFVEIDPSNAGWVNRVLAESGLWLTELRPIEPTLEDVFLTLTSAGEPR